MRRLTESERMALVNVERQARWFMGFFQRTANRIIAEAANDCEGVGG